MQKARVITRETFKRIKRMSKTQLEDYLAKMWTDAVLSGIQASAAGFINIINRVEGLTDEARKNLISAVNEELGIGLNEPTEEKGETIDAGNV